MYSTFRFLSSYKLLEALHSGKDSLSRSRSRASEDHRENEAGERMNEQHGEMAEVAVVRRRREGRAPVPALLP